MTLQQLIYFAEVAKELHFTKSAENLYVSQSSLSHTIQALETELDAPLFIRPSRKSVSLSKYGEIFLPYVNDALASLREGQRQVTLARSPVSGTVEVAYSHLDGSTLSTMLIEKFYLSEGNHNISFHRTVNHTGRAPIRELLQGNADIAIAGSKQDNNSLVSIPMAKQELFALLPKQHPLSGKASVTIEDIKNCQFSLCRENTELFQHITDMFRTSGCKLKNYKFYSDWATMVASISSGSAITISGKIAFETDAIKTIPLSHPDHIRQLYIVATDSKEKAPPVRRFLDFCCEYSHEGHSLIL